MSAAYCGDIEIDVFLGLRDDLCEVLPRTSNIRSRLKAISCTKALATIGADVTDVVKEIGHDWRQWNFVICCAEHLEMHDATTAKSILVKSLSMVREESCFGFYMKMLPVYVRICEADAWKPGNKAATNRCIRMLEEAHNKAMPRRNDINFLLMDLPVVVSLIILNSVADDPSTVFDLAGGFVALTEDCLQTFPAGSPTADEIRRNQTKGFAHLVTFYHQEGKHQLAVEAAGKCHDAWRALLDAHQILEHLNGTHFAWNLKGKAMLTAGQPCEAFEHLLRHCPLQGMPELQGASNGTSPRAMEEWMEIIEKCTDSMRPVSGLDCPSCHKPGTLLCTGCAAVFYCSPNCQRIHRKQHANSCAPSPLAQFTKSFFEFIDALHVHGFSSPQRAKQIAQAMPQEVERVYFLGGLSMIGIQAGMVPRFLRCVDVLLRKRRVEFAEILYRTPEIYVREQGGTILPAYMAVVRRDWKEVIRLCSAYKVAKVKTSLPCLFQAVALANLGYVQKAQNGLMEIFTLLSTHGYGPDSILMQKLNPLMLFVSAAGNLYPEEGSRQCFACGSKSSADGKLRHCKTCRAAWYCSEQCQDGDWQFHKLLCSEFVSAKDNPDILFAANREEAARAQKKMQAPETIPGTSQPVTDKPWARVRKKDLHNLASNERSGSSSTHARDEQDVRNKLDRCNGPNCNLASYSGPLLKCQQCKSVAYCSRECQKDHWKSEHRLSCASFRPNALWTPESVMMGLGTRASKE